MVTTRLAFLQLERRLQICVYVNKCCGITAIGTKEWPRTCFHTFKYEQSYFSTFAFQISKEDFMGGARGAKFPAGTWRHNDVVLTPMRRNDVASTSVRRHLPTRLFINQCQIITFLILKSDIENSRIELRGIVLPVPSNQIEVTLIIILPFNLVHLWIFPVSYRNWRKMWVDYWGGGGRGKGYVGPLSNYCAPPTGSRPSPSSYACGTVP